MAWRETMSDVVIVLMGSSCVGWCLMDSEPMSNHRSNPSGARSSENHVNVAQPAAVGPAYLGRQLAYRARWPPAWSELVDGRWLHLRGCSRQRERCQSFVRTSVQ